MIQALALFAAAALAGKCTDADMAKLQAETADSFNAETKKCALECGGQNPCTGNCITKEYGYSSDCGQCFGDLTSCAVAHCVVAPGNCGVDPDGSACASCMAEKCTPAFKDCTGVAAPTTLLGAPMATAKCTDDDQAKLMAETADTFNAETKKCALQCGGQNPCTGNCITSNYGYSSTCGQCFGDLTSCAVAHCVVAPGNCGVNPDGADCASCMASKCTPAFKECTGVAAPTTLLGRPMTSCTDDDMTLLNALTADTFSAETKKCALQCGGQNPCTGNCISRDYGYSSACGQCFGDLTSCTVAHCVVAPGNCGTAPNGSACSDCVNQYCTPAFETCTGWTPPSAARVVVSAMHAHKRVNTE